MAFVEDKKNDNSIFSCMRFLPEYQTYNRHNDDTINVNSGYRRIVPYMEAIQGGDTVKQSIRIRQLYEDFEADYIVLDLRNAGRNAVLKLETFRIMIEVKSGNAEMQIRQEGYF